MMWEKNKSTTSSLAFPFALNQQVAFQKKKICALKGLE